MDAGSSDEDEEDRLLRLLKIDATLNDNKFKEPEWKTDALRNLALELQNSPPEVRQSVLAANLLQLQEKYENTVDCLDPNTGLNNFAAGALALCAKNRNESDKWQSSISKDQLMSMSCVKGFIDTCQAESSRLAPPSDSTALWPGMGGTGEIGEGSKQKPLFTDPVSLPRQPPAKPAYQSEIKPAYRPTAAPAHPAAQPNQGRESTVCSKASSKWQSAFPQSSGSNRSHPAGAFSSFGKMGGRPGDDRSGEDMEDEDSGGPDAGGNRHRNTFRTAKEQFAIDQSKKYGGQDRGQSNFSYGASKKSLGTRRGPSNKFIPPVFNRDNENETGSSYGSSRRGEGGGSNKPEEPVDERLKGIEPKIIELITNEIMDHKPQMDWDDIAGLQFAKKTIKEIVVWPMLRPDIFTGLRGPPKGLLLFGPPGTGKTLIGKCIASQSKSTFFCISASSLTSKWVGEGEKMVRGLFAVARCHQPAVIFIDEVDSLLSQRSDGEHEASRRIKTEFLVQLDGATTETEDRILVIGATNRPQEIDEAARRRFVKRLYIPLPEPVARQHIVRRLMSQQKCQLTDADIDVIAHRTDGYSGADMANLCREAALGPIRSIPFEQMEFIQPDQVAAITMKDFEAALPQVRPSVSEKDLEVYITWNNTYGSFGQ